MTDKEKLLYSALIEARSLIGSFIAGEDMPRKYIDAVNKQIEDAVEQAAGGKVDGAGELF